MRKIILLASSIVIVLLAIAVFYILNRPAAQMSQAEKEKALTQIVGRKLNLNGNQAPTGDTTYKGPYSSFLYPARAKIYRQVVNGNEVKDEGALDYFSFDLEDPRVNVVTEVINQPSLSTRLSSYSAVAMRLSQKQIYTEISIQSKSGVSGTGFEKQDETGFEKTAFFLTNGKIYSISVKSADIKLANETYDKMVSSFKAY